MNKNAWYKDAVIYQIYPRSFKDSNNDGIGDIQGIIQKLDYLVDLGIDAIWLSPIFSSPMIDGGYDIADYCNIDPIFGTLDEFDNLINQAHKKNIRVLLDFVPNHTSLQHPWFIESRSSTDNPKRNWYIWKDPKTDGSAPNNWLSVAGGKAWEYDQTTKQYYLHSFLKEQPDLNWRNPEVVSAMCEVLRYWLKRGIDGFRVDAISYLLKDECFLDEPKNLDYIERRDHPNDILNHIYSKDQPGLDDLTSKFCQVLAEFSDKLMISEVYLASCKKYYHPGEIIRFYRQAGTAFNVPFNFGLIFQPWKMKAYKTVIDSYQAELKAGCFPVYILGNHDYPRIITRLGNEKKARLLALMQLTLPGTPFIYYGEEIGMTNGQITVNKDPFEEARDGQRTPMQWNNDGYAGFSETVPWLQVNDNSKICNTILQSMQKYSILNLYKTLIRLRKHKILSLGNYQPLDLKNTSVMAYLREYQGDRVLILLNFSAKSQKINTDYPEGTIYITTSLLRADEKITLATFPLDPYEGYIIKI